MAKITTIIPTYRRPKLLERAVHSVLNQTFSDFLIYIFDNASGDETADVVKQLQKQERRIHYVCRKKNIGLIQNFAQSTSEIKTPFFHFLCDDDFLLPWFYETAIQGFIDHPEAGMSVCRTLNIEKNTKLLPEQFSALPPNGFFLPPNSLSNLIHTIPTLTGILYHKRAIDSLGGFNPNIGTIFDVEFTLRVACRFPVVATPKPCAFFFAWEGSCTAQALNPPWPSWTKLYREIRKTLGELDIDPISLEKIKKALDKECNFKGPIRIWLIALQYRNLQAATLFKQYLHEDGNRKQAKLLSSILWICNHIPFSIFLIQSLILLRKRFRKFFYSFRMRSYLKQWPNLQQSFPHIDDRNS